MGSAEFAEKLPEMVIETARDITQLPVDVLKAEFPADTKYEKDVKKLSEYCRDQVTIGGRAGGSGFLGGRAIWQEAMELAGREERVKFFKTVAVKRLQELAEIAEKNGRPWPEKFGLKVSKLSEISEDWHSRY